MTSSSPADEPGVLVRRLASGAGWIVGAALIALGSAGVVSGLDHQPGMPARPELTWAGDRAVRRDLAAATNELAAISRQVDAVGVQGRAARGALAAREFETLQQAVDDGRVLVGEVRDRTARLRGRLEAMEAFGPGAEIRLSAATRERHARLLAALATTDGLPEAWARLASGGLPAARVSSLLERHDELVASAIEVGREGEYETAIERVDEAAAVLEDAGRLRADLADTLDAAALDEWLRRNRDYDTALKGLYQASAESPRFMTDDLRGAIRREREAREARDELPKDTSALVLSLADVAQGGLSQSIIGVEQVRGDLAAALSELRAAETASRSPAASPAP